jgi:hypothetical protein
MTSQAYQQEIDKWTAQGYCPTLVSGYAVGNQSRYAAIWEQRSCVYAARHDLTPAAYQKEFDSWVGQQGYRLKWVSGHAAARPSFLCRNLGEDFRP